MKRKARTWDAVVRVHGGRRIDFAYVGITGGPGVSLLQAKDARYEPSCEVIHARLVEVLPRKRPARKGKRRAK